jgi:hypothetical protein
MRWPAPTANGLPAEAGTGRSKCGMSPAAGGPSQVVEVELLQVNGCGTRRAATRAASPRNHRFVLGERIERSLYDLLETLVQAKYTRERTMLLEQANLKLDVLRFQARYGCERPACRVERWIGQR